MKSFSRRLSKLFASLHEGRSRFGWRRWNRNSLLLNARISSVSRSGSGLELTDSLQREGVPPEINDYPWYGQSVEFLFRPSGGKADYTTVKTRASWEANEHFTTHELHMHFLGPSHWFSICQVGFMSWFLNKRKYFKKDADNLLAVRAVSMRLGSDWGRLDFHLIIIQTGTREVFLSEVLWQRKYRIIY